MIQLGWSVFAVIAAAATVFITAVAIPWNMDEFIMYHVLACWQPEQQLNIYRESCTAYPTSLGSIEFYRSYAYSGITSSLIHAPFHFLVSSVWMPYVVGTLFLVGISVGVAKSLALPTQFAILGVVFFPVMFTVLHDGGPVRVALVTLAWTPLLAARYLRATTPQKVLPLFAMVLLWAVAAEDKPFFLSLIPGIAVFTIASFASRGLLPVAREKWRQLSGLLAALSTVSVLLLFALRSNDLPYLLHLRQMAPSPDLGGRALNAVQGGLFTVDWAYYAHRVSVFQDLGSSDIGGMAGKILAKSAFLPGFMTTETRVATALTALVIIAVLALYWRAVRPLLKGEDVRSRHTTILLLSATAALLLGAWISGGWATHHYVFAQVPLLALLMNAAAKRDHGLRNILTALIALAAMIWIIIWLTPTQPTASREIPKAFDVAIEAAGTDTIINCSSWGCYYTYSLLNEKNVPVVFADTPEHTTALEDVARADGRRVLHLCTECTLMSVADMYPQSDVTSIASNTAVWRVFQVAPR